MPRLDRGYDCPGCGTHNDGVTAVNSDDDIVPQAGDFSVCLCCGALLRYTEDGGGAARRVTPDDEAEGGPEVMAHLQRVRQYVMDRNFARDHLRQFNIADDVEKTIAEVGASGRVAILGGLLCSTGPPPRKMRPARKARCWSCNRAVWVNAAAPLMPVGCSGCMAEALNRERGS